MKSIGALFYILKNPSYMKPDRICKSVSDINLEELKGLGIKYLALDKDQTITAQDAFEYYNEEIQQWVGKAKDTFGDKNIAFLTNTREDIEKVHEKCVKGLGLPCIKTRLSKPNNSEEVLQYFGTTNPRDVCFIGDRVFTDVLVGKRIGAYTVLTKALTPELDQPSVKILRKIERASLAYQLGRKDVF